MREQILATCLLTIYAAATPLTHVCVSRAQVAFVGFAVQALVTKEGPIEGFNSHVTDPFGHNIITNIGSLQNRFSYYGST